MDTTVTIRPATEADLPAILAIYNDAVANTTAIWNDTLVDLDNRRQWMQARLAGNHPVLVADRAGEVIGSYHERWQVEASFRMSKTDLRARPMFVRTRDAIEAHLTVVFTALAVAREAQDRSGLAIRKIVRQLRTLRSATIAINGTRQTFEPEINDTDRALLDA